MITQAQLQGQGPPELTEEDDFRNSLEDMVIVLQKVGPLCTNIQGLIDMLTLAIHNDSQLNVIMHVVMPTSLKKVK